MRNFSMKQCESFFNRVFISLFWLFGSFLRFWNNLHLKIIETIGIDTWFDDAFKSRAIGTHKFANWINFSCQATPHVRACVCMGIISTSAFDFSILHPFNWAHRCSTHCSWYQNINHKLVIKLSNEMAEPHKEVMHVWLQKGGMFKIQRVLTFIDCSCSGDISVFVAVLL